MPTPEMNALSYAQLGKLTELIDRYWRCFSSYFPPKELWDAKLKEVSQIRHRVAHFRVGNEDDLARLKQFLRDIDKGFWRFCTSYNDIDPIIPPESNPVAEHFLAMDPLPWVEFQPKQWAQIGFRDKSLPVGLGVRSQRRPWCEGRFEDGKPGCLYDFWLFAQDGRVLDLPRLLELTRELHGHLAHFILEYSDSSVRLTVPAMLGSAAVVDLIQAFYDAAVSSARRGSSHPPDRIADAWPEYVIGSRNPLAFLDPSMECSFFTV